MAKRVSATSSFIRRPLVAGGAAALLLAPILLASAAHADPAPTAPPTQLAAGSGINDIVVPNGVCSVNVTIGGGRGGLALGESTPDPEDPDNPTPGELGGSRGSGAKITALLNLTAGDLLTVNVGGDGSNGGIGGINGDEVGAGGNGGTGGHRGGGGGGYTSVTVNGDELLLAGGGGGTGGGHQPAAGFGGHAGFGQVTGVPVAGGIVYPGEAGVDGFDGAALDIIVGAGGGGTETAGGAGGIHPGATAVTPDPTADPVTDPAAFNGFLTGSNGGSRAGGNGGVDPNLDTGGGGGSGFFGGGGGGSTTLAGAYTGGGGGGGSSFVTPDSALLSDVALSRNSLPGNDPEVDDGLAAPAFATLEWVMCDYNLSIEKSVVGNPVFEDGGTVQYSVTITNDGPDIMAIGDTVTLIDDLAVGGTLVSIDGLDTSIPEVGEVIPAGGIELFDTIELPNPDPTIPEPVEHQRGLAVGDSVTVVYDVVVTGDEPVTNTASTSDRNGEVTDDAVVDPADPSVALVKSADVQKVTQIGQKVTYSFLVTNTGNIDLHNVSIDEGTFSGAGTLPTPTCPTEPVAPSASVTCTSVYTVLEADLTGKDLTNTATALAETPMGAPVVSLVSEVKIPTVKPALASTGLQNTSVLALGVLVLLGAGAVALTGGTLVARNKKA